MKLSKGILYYFAFWILYIPISIVLTLMLNFGLEEFFVSIGLGAGIQFVFLSVRLIVMKFKEKPEVSEDDIVEQNAVGVQNETTQLA